MAILRAVAHLLNIANQASSTIFCDGSKYRRQQQNWRNLKFDGEMPKERAVGARGFWSKRAPAPIPGLTMSERPELEETPFDPRSKDFGWCASRGRPTK